jgi:4a-hydroxytetrahydrobiopterin dehydratase
METQTTWIPTEKGLTRDFLFKDFEAAFRFITAVAQLAEQQNHHPDIWNSYNKVRLTLFSHDVQAITDRDYTLAKCIDAL